MSSNVNWEVDRPDLSWALVRMHNPRPLPPLSQDLWGCVGEGRQRIQAAFGRPFLSRNRFVNGFLYTAQEPAPPSSAPTFDEQEAAVTLERDWKERYLPEVLRIYSAMDRFDAFDADGVALADYLATVTYQMTRLSEIHFLVVLPAYTAINAFLDYCQPLFPEASDLNAARLLQGYGNKTTEAGDALDDLARVAEENELLPVLRNARTLEDLSGSPTFASHLQAVLTEYGPLGADEGDAFGASWADDLPRFFGEILGRTGRTDDLRGRRMELVRERDTALAEARARLGEEERRRFDDLHDQARAGVILTEDHHFYIDRNFRWRERRLVLKIGAQLVRRDVIDQDEDVYFLTLAEVTGALRDSSNLRHVAAGRRAEFARWQMLDPPARLGAPPPEGAAGSTDEIRRRHGARFMGAPVAQTTQGVIRGSAASPGVAIGPARVVTRLEEADGIRPGDVLVCTTTNASWVTLFKTVAAVVTDTGGVLSHCAVVAREYGLPAVVGTGVATRAISDGQMVEVDGIAGEVRVL